MPERRGDYHQLAGPTGAWVVPPNRKRKAEDLFGDDDDNNNKAAILKTWPGRAAADIFLPPSAGAAGGAFFANPAAIRAVAAARRHVADRFPNPRPVATRNDKNGGNKRRCVAQATLHHHLRPLQSCFADVDEVARPPVPVRGVSGGLPPAVGPRDGGLVFRMWPGREFRLGERGQRKRRGVPAPLVGLEGVDGEVGGWVVERGSAGVVLVEKGEEEMERERAERALVMGWVGGVVAEEGRLRAEWEEARAGCPDWAELLAARARA
ncbi:hypothetical protein SLS55_002126 [Diplodia seriata]|uniref:Uncharacterized protein n=1 Tax=Diplodia seriata TaxID=420778 RepID=A0ABR3CRA9_9PEZI